MAESSPEFPAVSRTGAVTRRRLDDRHAVFGQVEDGMDVVEEIGALPTDRNDQPREDVEIEDVETDR